MTFRTRLLRQAVVIAALAAFAACGGGYSSPTSPSGGSGTSGQSGATITITASGVNPAQVTISVGQSVTFVNNDSRGHQIASDPHPTHTDCPAITALGTIGAGQTKLTDALTTARTCGFHDHNDPDNAALKGSIVVR